MKKALTPKRSISRPARTIPKPRPARVAPSKRADARPRASSSPAVAIAMKPRIEGTDAAVDRPARTRVPATTGMATVNPVMTTAMKPKNGPSCIRRWWPKRSERTPKTGDMTQLGDVEQGGQDADHARLDAGPRRPARNGRGDRSSRAPVRPVLRRRVNVPSRTAVSERSPTGRLGARVAGLGGGWIHARQAYRAGWPSGPPGRRDRGPGRLGASMTAVRSSGHPRPRQPRRGRRAPSPGDGGRPGHPARRRHRGRRGDCHECRPGRGRQPGLRDRWRCVLADLGRGPGRQIGLNGSGRSARRASAAATAGARPADDPPSRRAVDHRARRRPLVGRRPRPLRAAAPGRASWLPRSSLPGTASRPTRRSAGRSR